MRKTSKPSKTEGAHDKGKRRKERTTYPIVERWELQRPDPGPNEDRPISVELRGIMNGARRVSLAGNLAGLYDGIANCVGWYKCGEPITESDQRAVVQDQASVPVPRWILRQMLRYMQDELRAKGACPTRKWLKQWERDMKTANAVEAVECILEHGVKWTDGEVYEQAARYYLPNLTPTQVEGRFKRGRRVEKENSKRHYSPMFLKLRDKS